MNKDLILMILLTLCVIITITDIIFNICIIKSNNFNKLQKTIDAFSYQLDYLKTDVSNSYNTLLSDINNTKKDYITTLETAKKEAHIVSHKLQLLILELDSCLTDNVKINKEYLLKKYPENRANFNIKVKAISEKPKIESKIVPNSNDHINKKVTIGDLVNKNNKE